jgi:hypothetical protein
VYGARCTVQGARGTVHGAGCTGGTAGRGFFVFVFVLLLVLVLVLVPVLVLVLEWYLTLGRWRVSGAHPGCALDFLETVGRIR